MKMNAKDMNIERKRAWIKGLLLECPFIDELDDCPARELRKLSFDEKIDAVDRMDEKMIHNIIMYHNRCLHRRES
jgi:hypothetical protein